MYWITPTIDTFLAAGTCALLLGLLFVSMRNRKIASRPRVALLGAHPFPAPQKQSATKPTSGLRYYTNQGLPADADKTNDAVKFQPPKSVNVEPPNPVIPAVVAENPVAVEKSHGLPALPPTFVELLSSPVAEDHQENIREHFEQAPTISAREAADQTAAMSQYSFTVEQHSSSTNAIVSRNEETHAEKESAGEECSRPAPNLLSFYGLHQQPFDVTPDPAFLYLSPRHREALESISMGVDNLRGFMALIAEPGMGKTTLLNKLMEDLRDSARVVFLFQTQCNSSELLRYLLNELEVDYEGTDIVEMHRVLSHALFEEMLQGRRFVLIVDEAQNLQGPVLETIRLLSDYETTHSKLIQIILAGQPQMVETLLGSDLVQLRQRIAVLASLVELTAAETSTYIQHRLRAAGWAGTALFSPDAVRLITEVSGGVPRSINNLCFNAMLAGYLQRKTVIDRETVQKVATKLDIELLARRPEKNTTEVPADRSCPSQLAKALAAAANADGKISTDNAAAAKSKPMPNIMVTGNLNEKIRTQSWGRKHEYRIEASFERDPASGTPVADRYYCCNFYVSEEQATNLRAGKPIRIKFEQD